MKEYDNKLGCNMINALLVFSLHSICLYTACSSGEELKFIKNLDLLKWNINCGKILNSGDNRNEVASSFLYVANFAHSLINAL